MPPTPVRSSASVSGYISTTPGRWKRRGAWRLVFYLSPWRATPNRPVCMTPLRVEILLGQAAREPDGLEKGMAVGFDLESLEPPGDRGSWLAHGLLPVRPEDPDPELATCHVKLSEPVTVSDAVLGQLELDREFNWYRGRCQRPALPCEVIVKRSKVDEDRASDGSDIERARAAVLYVEEHLAEYRERAAEALLDLRKRYFRDAGSMAGVVLASELRVRCIRIEAARHTISFEGGDADAVEVTYAPGGAVLDARLGR
jgi:hypothetical protein